MEVGGFVGQKRTEWLQGFFSRGLKYEMLHLQNSLYLPWQSLVGFVGQDSHIEFIPSNIICGFNRLLEDLRFFFTMWLWTQMKFQIAKSETREMCSVHLAMNVLLTRKQQSYLYNYPNHGVDSAHSLLIKRRDAEKCREIANLPRRWASLEAQQWIHCGMRAFRHKTADAVLSMYCPTCSKQFIYAIRFAMSHLCQTQMLWHFV